MSATDELRRMLDERGVKWGNIRNDGSESDYLTEWQFDGIQSYAVAIEWAVGSGLSLETHRQHLTPAQAIDATVGRGMCQMECAGRPTERTLDVMGVYFCSKCGSPIYNDCMPSYCIYCGAEVTL